MLVVQLLVVVVETANLKTILEVIFYVEKYFLYFIKLLLFLVNH